MNTNTAHYIIFSVDLTKDTPEDRATKRNFTLGQMLNYGVLFQVVQGVYKNTSEQSYMVRLPTFGSPEYHATLARVIGLARGAKQESILYIHNDLHTELMMLEAKETIPLGTFSEVDKVEALSHDAYTIIGDRYYIAKQ